MPTPVAPTRPPSQVFGADLYAGQDTVGAPQAAVAASLGCGVPTAVADLHEGETVLDLGSGRRRRRAHQRRGASAPPAARSAWT